MKLKLVLIFFLAALGILIAAAHVRGTDCFRFAAPVHAKIYSEADLASNIVATVEPNDVFYFCGDDQ
jgi:hypothetical protein